MAKGNLFLGTAQKKLGDVVLYRRNGVQQSRVRVRNIANPKTEGQALQRNYLAPVTKFYAPLAGVLERSWEGLDKSRSYSAFIKANVALARNNGWYVEKGAGFTPLPYKVSKGIMDPFVYSYNDSTGKFVWAILGLSSGTGHNQIGFISKALVNLGYQYGDQVTIVLFIGNESLTEIRPAWFRFLLNESNEETIGDLLPYELDANVANGKIEFSGDIDAQLIGGAIIASRWDGSKWLRSTQYVELSAEYMNGFTSMEAREAAIASYRGGSQVVSSDVYLNGGTGSTGTQDQGVQVNFYGYQSGETLGICKLKSVRKSFPTDGFVGVFATNAASGSSMLFNVVKGGTGADKNHVLQDDGTFDASDEVTILVLDYTKSGEQLQQFLAANGVTIE